MDIQKLLKDFSKEIDKSLEINLRRIESDKSDSTLKCVVDEFLVLEKKTRLNNDLESSKKLAKAIIQIFIDRKDWDKVGEYTILLCNKHAQLKQVISEVVRLTMDSLVLTPNDGTKLYLLKVLREISKGQMVVELEFARMTKMYSLMKEKAGDMKASCEILHEVHVDTLSTMDFEEKFDFLLEQLRLAMAIGDFDKAELTTSRFNVKWLDKRQSANAKSLKSRYYELLVQFYSHEKKFIKTSESFLSLMDLDSDALSPSSLSYLKKAVLNASVGGENEESIALRNRILGTYKKGLNEPHLDTFKNLLVFLTEQKLVSWPLSTKMLTDISAEENNSEFLERLKSNVVFHNISVLSKYYSRIPFDSLSAFINLNEEESEKAVCTMVQENLVKAVIDRPNKTVIFEMLPALNELLDKWGEAISATLSKVNRVCHLIEKENVLFGVSK